MAAKRQRALDLVHAGLTAQQISSNLIMPISTVYRILKVGTAERKARTTPSNKKTTPKFLQKLKKSVEADPTKSIRNVAKKLNVHERTIRRSLKVLGKKSVVRPARHLLTERTKLLRLERGLRLLNRLKHMPASTVKIFSDKKIFTVDQVYNRRNDRQIINTGEQATHVSRTKHPASIMFLGIVASNGKKAPPIFIPEGEKVNTEAYISILKAKVLPWLKKTFPQNNYEFQQDGAPAHTSNRTQEWIRTNFAGFWDKTVWPPSSPDLNPLDFSVWSVVESKAFKTPHDSISSLKTSVAKAWRALQPSYIIKTCRDFRPRLERVIEADGGLIE
jgi:transposase